MKLPGCSLRNQVFLLFIFITVSFACKQVRPEKAEIQEDSVIAIDTLRQKAVLEKILRLLPPDRPSMGRVSYLDGTLPDWLARTGELPPDFDRMTSIPFLPDPLIIDEGGKNIPVRTMEQWKEKREWIKKQLEYYMTGSCPPEPGNLKAVILSERKEGETTLKMVELTFGPYNKARLTLELMIPQGSGPLPVFLTQWNHREWAQVAVRRGYIGCLYAGADSKDDTEKYSEIWAGQYDFTRLMRRAYGGSRAIDYLYTLPYVDKEKIAMTGHSRNGDQSFFAAAFDERITAVVPSSGTGQEVPWRYSAKKYDIEDIALLASAQPSWYQPRLRFFYGRENKLPVDNNLFMALIAPRGLMLSSAINEGAGNPWGSEQAYYSALKVYKFLGAEKNLAIRLRQGLHSISARDMEDYIDFFDYVFKRSSYRPEDKFVCNYSFDKWKEQSGEKINPEKYGKKGLDDLLTDDKGQAISTFSEWKRKNEEIKKRINLILGDEPPGVYNPGPGRFVRGGGDENNFGTHLIRPQANEKMGRMPVSPYNGFGDQLFGYLYYPAGEDGGLSRDSLPVIIYLHEYDYSKGFNSYHQIESFLQSVTQTGYGVFIFDMIGFGNRIEEGTRFYDRYPHWSKMGKMITDVRGAVDALSNFKFVDKSKIFAGGYALGATVGLYAAALDERIAGVVSVAGFTPMRLSTPEKGIEGVKAYSHLHGLLPRLGFFVNNEARIPYDFHEILACIAPRPLLVIAPQMDKDAVYADVSKCFEQAAGIYGLYEKRDQIELFAPDDYNRFSPEMREKTCKWLMEISAGDENSSGNAADR